jgi:hypothetical protein
VTCLEYSDEIVAEAGVEETYPMAQKAFLVEVMIYTVI